MIWSKERPTIPGNYIVRDPISKMTLEVVIAKINGKLMGRDAAGHFEVEKETGVGGAFFGHEWHYEQPKRQPRRPDEVL